MFRPLLVWLSCVIACQANTLKVGDQAPDTRPEIQIQGETVKTFEKGKVYIFECWATWCPPCVASIPHLNELHRKLGPKGVVITGVNVWEGEKSPVAAEKVREFVKTQGEKMSYAVAIGGNQFMKDWLEAARVEGIPHAFIVSGEGKLIWEGHPMDLNEEILGDMITGSFSPQKASAPKKEEQNSLNTAREKFAQLDQAIAKKDWALAEKIAPELIALLPEKNREEMQRQLEFTIAYGKGDLSKIYSYLEKLSEEKKSDPNTLNEIAWDLVTNPIFEKNVNLALAEKCASQALQITQENNPEILDTLARVRFMQGNKEGAIQLQERAIAKATYTTLKDELQATLDSYKKGILPKISEAPLSESPQ
jgi:thiol-disulfide isomerase/thioredoxin